MHKKIIVIGRNRIVIVLSGFDSASVALYRPATPLQVRGVEIITILASPCPSCHHRPDLEQK